MLDYLVFYLFVVHSTYLCFVLGENIPIIDAKKTFLSESLICPNPNVASEFLAQTVEKIRKQFGM